jgi:hypothetical protein
MFHNSDIRVAMRSRRLFMRHRRVILLPRKATELAFAGCIAVTFGFWQNAHAQSSASVQYAAELDQVPASCRVAAMGDAGVAVPLDASGVFWNPAAHAFVNHYEISAEYARLYGDLSSHGCAAIHIPLQEQMSVDAFYERYQSGAIKEWDSLPGTPLQRLEDPSLRADGSDNGLFYNDQNSVILSLAKIFPMPIPRPESYSYPLPIDLSAGISFKDFWQTLNPYGKVYMGMNINCDAGLLLRVSIDYDLVKKQVCREVFAGVTVKDFLGTNVVWLHSPDNYQENVDASEYYGISYIDRTHFLGANWLVSFALEKSYDVTYHGGIEAQFFDMVSLRAGLSEHVWTCGAGIAYRSYSLDYAFRFDDIDYSPLRIALRVSF